MALSEMPRCSVSNSLDLAATVASETRCLSLRSASTLCLTRSTVRWRSLAYTFSSSQGCGSGWSFGPWLDLDNTALVLSVGDYHLHFFDLQITRSDQLA